MLVYLHYIVVEKNSKVENNPKIFNLKNKNENSLFKSIFYSATCLVNSHCSNKK